MDIAPCRRREACPHASAVFGVISLDRGAMWASLPTGICGAMWASLPTRGWGIIMTLPTRKWPRLNGWDYSKNGLYFLTICTEGKKCILSSISPQSPHSSLISLTATGEIVDTYIKTIQGIDKYVIMPNHVHMIIQKSNGKPISSDVRSFKTLTTKKLGYSIWQKYYYDHIIRDEHDYLIKWDYIDKNPGKWFEDEYFPMP